MNPKKLYATHTAGGMMGTEFIALPEDINVKEAVERIRSSPQFEDKPAYVYVVDRENHLKGVLFLRDLIFSPSHKPLKELSRQKLITIAAETDREEAARIFQKHSLMALPVIDKEGLLIGTISANDVSNIIEEEATEDILKVAGIGGGSESFKAHFVISLKHRLPWLALNIFLDLIAVSVIACYESTMRQVIALAVILPVISDMGGNVGIQTVSLAIRELATGEITFKDFGFIITRELGIGFLNGLALGILLGIVGYIWKGNIFLGIVAGLTLWINTIIASITGAAIPLVLKKRGLDPATASGALLTTITDLSGFFLALSLATYLLPHLK